jgi:hypothetical protein
MNIEMFNIQDISYRLVINLENGIMVISKILWSINSLQMVELFSKQMTQSSWLFIQPHNHQKEYFKI